MGIPLPPDKCVHVGLLLIVYPRAFNCDSPLPYRLLQRFFREGPVLGCAASARSGEADF